MTVTRLLLIITSAIMPAFAETNSVINFSIDNDGFFGVDYDYTHGSYLSYTTDANPGHYNDNFLTLSSADQHSIDRYQFVVGQQLWTPRDLRQTRPIENDRAYAGFLYSEFNYLTLTQNRTVRYNLTLGVIGPNARAEQSQNLAHTITKSTKPAGWDYQIDEGVQINVGYRNHYLLQRQKLTVNEWDVIALTEGNVGTFRSDVSHGVIFRIGEQLTNSTGAVDISLENPFDAGAMTQNGKGWFAYLGFKGRYRIHDITISGDRANIANQADYEVTLSHWQAVATSGVAWHNQNLGLALSFSVKTADYDEAKHDLHGNASLSFFHYF